MVLYDLNDDEVNHITDKMDVWEENQFTISHPEPYARPSIALNFTHEQIAELRGVCFTDSFSFQHKDEDVKSWKSKLPDPCQISKIVCAKIIVNLVLIIAWVLFFTLIWSGTIATIEVDTTNRWTILTFIFIILVLTTISTKKLFSRRQNKCDLPLKASKFHHPFQCLPCFNQAREEETTILYSVKT